MNATENLQVIPIPSGIEFTWLDDVIRARATRITEDPRTRMLWADLDICSYRNGNNTIMPVSRVNLSSPTSRQQLALQLAGWPDYLPWDQYLNAIIENCYKHYRLTEPAVKIRDIVLEDSIYYRLQPLIPENQLTVIYGKGGSGKSTLACLIAVLVQDGISDYKLIPTPGNVLYLDYEQDQTPIKRRIDAIRTELTSKHTVLDTEFDILYRRCSVPLVDDIDSIKALVDNEAITLVIIDGLGYAIAGDTQREERVLMTASSIRQLDRTVLAIDHEAKTSDGETPFGSVYKYNAARSLFQVRSFAGPDTDSIQLALIHKKRNDGKLLPIMAFQINHIARSDNQDILDRIDIEAIEAADIPEMADNLPNWQRMKDAILQEGAMTAKEIAEATGITENIVRAEVSRRKGLFVRLEGKKIGVIANV